MASFKAAQLKVSSFYGSAVPRPYVLLDKDGKLVEDRVDAPQVNEALIAWATKVPIQRGGALTKPTWDGPEMPREARTDFQIFFLERFDDIHAANPAILASDRRSMLSAASVYWREQLEPEERLRYRERAAAEKAAVGVQIAEAEQANPKFKAFRDKLQRYKQSMSGILGAAKASTGPLWRAQRRMNKYRALEEHEAAREEVEESGNEGEEATLAGGSKKGRKGAAAAGGAHKRGGKAAGRGEKAAARQRLVGSDDSSSEEEGEEEDARAAADAVAAMQKLLLATAKKGGKPAKAAPGSGRATAATRKAAAAREEEQAVSSDSEEEEEGSPQQQRAGRGRGTRSGAAALASRAVSRGRKGMYEDAFELPPSQNATPAKPLAAAAPARGGKAAAADLPSKSPGKRMRTTRHSAVAAAPVAEESPAKKLRRSARK